jgi:hypothetical protein
MNIEAVLRFVTGSIVLLLVVGVTACHGEDSPVREPLLDFTPGPRGYILICNATTETIRYRSWYPDTPEKSLLQTLAPDGSHLYADCRDFNCRYGAPKTVTDSLLRRGTIYVFRATKGKPRDSVTLVAVSQTAGGPLTPELSAPSRIAANPSHSREALNSAVATAREHDLELTIKRLEGEVKRLSTRPIETRPAVEKTVAPRGIGLRWSGKPIRLGPLDLSAGAAKAELTLSLEREHGAPPTALKLTAEFKPARGTARVRPETTEMPADGVLKLLLAFEGVPAAGTRLGKLIVYAGNSPQDRGLVIPATVMFRSGPPVLSTDGETVSILSWPPGADVYLVDESRDDAWSLEHMGLTPVACRLPLGRYQAVLVRRDRVGGEWLASEGQSLALRAGTKETSRVWVSFEKRASTPTLVRAVWVDHKGSAAEQLDRATSDSPDLFNIPPFDEFHVPFAEVVARAGIALADQDAKMVYQALRRCGWLRFELAQGAAIEVESVPTADGQQFRFTPVLLRPELSGVRTAEGTP